MVVAAFRKSLLSVFCCGRFLKRNGGKLNADMEKKKERIVNLYGETGASPEKRLKKKNKTRAMNYKYYTDRTWGRELPRVAGQRLTGRGAVCRPDCRACKGFLGVDVLQSK